MEKRAITFPVNLRSIRKSKGMSQSELARQVGVDQRTVSAWENGICEPGFSVLAILAEMFDETLDNLIFG